MRTPAIALAFGVLVTAACVRQSPVAFRVENARAHIERLAGTIGSRPIGTPGNAAARAYLIDQLRVYGFDVRVQEGEAFDDRTGLTARVANIIALKPGSRPEALALVAHYDSRPEAPGAMDDGIGVAVALEAGRLLAARPQARHSLIVLLTDGEEIGLMGAVHAVDDAELRGRIRAYLNLEATGASGPGILFESGPGNEPLIRAWARAPRPRGSSFAVEIYKRLPNDTDFTVFRRAGIPGLNFAPVGDSYAYHTSRDRPERVPSATLFQMGETAVATIEALDAADVPAERRDVRFSDILSRHVVILTDTQARILLAVGCLAVLVAWVRQLRHLLARGVLPALCTVVWSVLSGAAGAGAMVGAVWLLRAWREAYHPWYASPLRFLALLAVCAVAAAWVVTRLARLLPERVRYVRTPASVWTVTLPVWTALAVASEIYAPSAAHLWSLPIAAAGVLLAVAPPGREVLARLAALAVLPVVLALFARDGLVLFEFLVAVFGRLPIVTPLAVHPALLGLVGLMVAPPAIAAAIGLVRGRSHGVTGACLLVALAVTIGLAFSADAYTSERPLRRSVLYLNDRVAGQTIWEVGGNEPGLDLDLPSAEAAAWRPVDASAPLRATVPIAGASGAFRFRRAGDSTPPPATLTFRQGASPESPDRIAFELVVSPVEDGVTVGLQLPPGILPEEASPRGVVANGAWRARHAGVSRSGAAFRGVVPASAAPELARAVVVVASPRLPGPGGPLPPWLPRTRTDWSARAVWILPLSAASPPVEPPAALR